MAAIELQERKNLELKRPNCFTLEEIKAMLKETNRDKDNGIYVTEKEMHELFRSFQ